jgi:hypothetical protein
MSDPLNGEIRLTFFIEEFSSPLPSLTSEGGQADGSNKSQRFCFNLFQLNEASKLNNRSGIERWRAFCYLLDTYRRDYCQVD